MKTPQTEQDSLSSRNKFIWILLLLLGGGTYFIGFKLPSTLAIKAAQVAGCPKKLYDVLSYECNPFDVSNPILSMEIENIKSSDQFLALQAVPILKNGVNDQKITFHAEISIFAVGPEYSIKKIFFRKNERKITFNCVQATGGCAPETFAEVPNVEDSHFVFIVKFINNNVLEARVSDVRLAFVTFNPAFQEILTYVKYALFAVSIVSWFLYRRRIAPLSSSQKSIEQKYVGFMALLLILFNEPFINYVNINRDMSYTIVVVIINSAQTAVLTMLWLLILERLASPDDEASPVAQAFIKIVGFIHFVVSSISYWMLANDQVVNHLMNFQTDEDFIVLVSRYYLYGFLGLVAFWTLIRLFQILPKFGQLEWRDGTSLAFAFCYFLCYGFFLYGGNLQAINFKGPRVVLLYGVTTLYTLLFEIIYSPSLLELEEAEKARSYRATTEEKVEYGELDMSDSNNSRSQAKDSRGLRSNDANKKQKPSVIVDDDDDI